MIRLSCQCLHREFYVVPRCLKITEKVSFYNIVKLINFVIFWKTKACSQIVLPDKWNWKLKWDIFGDFQTMCGANFQGKDYLPLAKQRAWNWGPRKSNQMRKASSSNDGTWVVVSLWWTGQLPKYFLWVQTGLSRIRVSLQRQIPWRILYPQNLLWWCLSCCFPSLTFLMESSESTCP